MYLPCGPAAVLQRMAATNVAPQANLVQVVHQSLLSFLVLPENSPAKGQLQTSEIFFLKPVRPS